ncbi:MAG: XrtA/PEP-CTERM system exopolysaccharide export protein [Dokdonella sp.]
MKTAMKSALRPSSNFALLRVIAGFALAVVAASAVTASAQNAPAGSATAATMQAGTKDSYRIGVDDILQVSVWHNADLSVTVPVRPDGRISMPLVGDVEVGGHTPQEVAEDIKTRLAVYVRDPQVAIILTDLRSHEYLSRVRVTGAVRQPVSIPYRQGMTVLDLVLAAGGTTDFASADNTKLYRKDPSGIKTFDVRLDKLLKKGDLSTNMPVQPGDVVTVPERLF